MSQTLGVSLQDLERCAAQMQQIAPVLRDEADNLPEEMLGSPELSQQYAALMRRFGRTGEGLADDVAAFADLYRHHLQTGTVSSPALAPQVGPSAAEEGPDAHA